MIVSIRDIHNNLRDAASTVAMIAGITSIGKSKKTLVMQFTLPTEESVLNVLSGHEIMENSIQGSYNFSDDGLDGLSMRAETADLTDEHFNECVTPLLEKEHMLDVLKPTKKNQYREVVSGEVIENILASASNIYDYIYILIPSDDEEICSLVTSKTDEDLVIIPQGCRYDVDLSNGKTYLAIKGYESTSKFDLGSMKKKYGVKKIYTIPYNVEFRDSVISQTTLDFILKNRKDMKEDVNYHFVSSLLALVSRYVTNKDDDEAEEMESLPTKPEKDKLMVEDQQVLPEYAVQEVMVKEGLFRKKKKIMVDM